MPCHHALAEALRAYIDAAGIAEDRKGWLFRTSRCCCGWFPLLVRRGRAGHGATAGLEDTR